MLLLNDLLQSQQIEPSAIASGEAFGTPTTLRTFNVEGSGGAVVGGGGIIKRSYKPSGNGPILMGGTAPFRAVLNIDIELVWQTRTTVTLDQNIKWNTGRVPLRWYRVQGCCQYPTADGDGIGEGQPGGCDVGPLQTNDDKCKGALGKNQFIQNIIASNVNDVCKTLKELRWKWPICGMDRFSRPAEAQFVDEDDECNILEPVEFCNEPECQEFCLASDGVVRAGVTVEIIDTFYAMVGSGIVRLGGTAPAAIVTPSASGSGGIILGGTAPAASSYWSYTPAEGEAGIILDGEAPVASSYWEYTGSGEIVLGGISGVVKEYWAFTGSGDIVMDGDAEEIIIIPYEGSGGVTIAGEAVWGNFYVYPEGGITLGGTAPATTPAGSFIGEGGIVLGGTAGVVKESWGYTGSGTVYLGGIAPASVEAPVWEYTGDGTITLAGVADTQYSGPTADSWWFTGSGTITLGGVAVDHRWIGSGTITLGGEAGWDGSWRDTDDASIGAKAEILDLEVVFSSLDSDVLTLQGLSSTVSTKCSTCTALPLVLDMSHNLAYAGVLREFLLRNGLMLPEVVKMRYNTVSGSWQGNLHYRGISDASSATEQWAMLFEWACVDELGSSQLGSYIWKWSVYIKRKNTVTGLDFDSRILIAFPAEPICEEASRVGLDFSFAFDTQRQYVNAERDIVVDVRLLYDNIGLFKSDRWIADPDLLINISEEGQGVDILRQDIKPIFPVDEVVIVPEV